MKTRLLIFMAVALFTCANINLHGAVLVHEGFSANTTNNLSIEGFDGTATSTGLTGAWDWGFAGDMTESEQRLKVSGATWVGINGGYAPDGVGGGNRTFWEKNNNWGNSMAQCSLSSSINMTVDGTYYMSFFSKSNHNNAVTQVGLNDGTDELMWGNGFAGAAGSNKGVTAYYGAINTNPITGGSDTYLDDSTGGAQTFFWVAKLVKSDSGNTNTLTVNIMGYNLTSSNVVDSGDPVTWTRTVTLTGVSTTFTNLQMKLNGGNDGSGNNWPAIDEVRIGQSWLDVTGVDPKPYGESVDQVGDTTKVQVTLNWNAASDPNGSISGNAVLPDIVDQYVFLTTGSTTDPNLYYIGATGADPLDNPGSQYGPLLLDQNTTLQWAVVEALTGFEQSLAVDVSTLDDVDPNNIIGLVWEFTTIVLDPIFTDDTPDSVTVPAGDPASFSITAQNQTTTTWYQSTDTVVDAGDTVVDTGDTLNLTDVQVADEGWYYAVISNGETEKDLTSQMARLMTRRLAGWWKLDGDLTDSVTDVVATAPTHNGSATFSSFSTGIDSDAAVFQNDPNYVVTIADSNDYFNFYPQGITLNVWVNTTQGDSWRGPVTKLQTNGASADTGFAMWSVMDNGWTGSSLNNTNSASTIDVNDGAWHMMTMTYDPGVGTDNFIYYLDGEQVGQNTVSNPLLTVAPVLFGKNGLDTSRKYTGLIDDVAIYSYAIADTEVLDLYNAAPLPDKELCLNSDQINEALDLVDDCKINLLDFAVFAEGWLGCGLHPTSSCP